MSDSTSLVDSTPLRQRIMSRLNIPRNFPVCILFIAIVVSIGVRAVLIGNKTTLHYDESISYLAATCHQNEYRLAPFGTKPTPIGDWHRLLQIEDRFCFQEIQSGLAQADIHPPLYFWLLHIWFLIFGVSLWSGPLLNVAISLVTTVCLYFMAMAIWQNQWVAVLTAVSFALSPSTILISLEARQYELLALLTVLTVWGLLSFIKRGTFLSAIVLVGGGIGGSLTHYHFLLTLIPCVILPVAKFSSNRRRAGQTVALLITSYSLGTIIHPFFLNSLSRLPDRVPTFSMEALYERLLQVVLSFSSFYYLLPVIVIGGLFYLRTEHRRNQFQLSYDIKFIMLFTAWIVLAIAGQYLTFRSPTHAMGPPKYLAMVWPFVAFLPPLTLRWFKGRKSLALYFFLVPLLLAAIMPLVFPQQQRLVIPATTSTVLIDHTARGLVLPIIWLVPESTNVVVARQDDLLDDLKWLSYMDEESIYIGNTTEGNSIENVWRIKGLIQQQQGSTD
jgi:uncharacterized membrane protein